MGILFYLNWYLHYTKITYYSYREFNYTSFTREFALPNNVDTTETRAKYDNGILTILLPKTTTNTNYKTVKIS